MVNDQTGAFGNTGKWRSAEEERRRLHTNAVLWILVSLSGFSPSGPSAFTFAIQI